MNNGLRQIAAALRAAFVSPASPSLTRSLEMSLDDLDKVLDERLQRSLETSLRKIGREL